MQIISPETTAHNIAKIFCDHKYEEVLSDAHRAYKSGCCNDPDVAAAKELADLYLSIYDVVYESVLCDNEDFKEFE